MTGHNGHGWRNGVLLALVILGSMSAASAQGPFNDLGRHFGICCGDGYHACAEPSFSAGPCDDACGPRSSCAALDPMQAQALGFYHRPTTYYDRFGASSQRFGMTPGDCNCTTVTNAYGSEVMVRPLESPTPTPAAPPEAETIPIPPPSAQQGRAPAGRRLAQSSRPVERIAQRPQPSRRGVLMSRTPNKITPLHPGHRPLVEHLSSANSSGQKLYPTRLPVAPPKPVPAPAPPAPPQPLMPRIPLVQMEGVGEIRANPFVAGSGVGVAAQPSFRAAPAVQQPR